MKDETKIKDRNHKNLLNLFGGTAYEDMYQKGGVVLLNKKNLSLFPNLLPPQRKRRKALIQTEEGKRNLSADSDKLLHTLLLYYFRLNVERFQNTERIGRRHHRRIISPIAYAHCKIRDQLQYMFEKMK